MLISAKDNIAMLEDLSDPKLSDNPFNFAMWAYEWGEGDLKDFPGPRKWQREVMLDVAGYLKTCRKKQDLKESLPDFFRCAIASGRGPGKSALVGMLAHWFISTRIGGSVWVAANGEPQLRTKTFPEIAKWVARGLNGHWFEVNSMSIQPAKWFKEMIESPVQKGGLGKSTRYYYASGQLWSEENPDAFAGAHNNDGEMAIFDEASGIPDRIWTVQEGVFTENIPDRFWFCFSNPRKNSGAFFETFNKNRDLWRTRQIDSRTVEGISHSTFENIIKQYGEDSDEARIEVKGEFPLRGETQFIDGQKIRDAAYRETYQDPGAPLIMGVDVARFGVDKSVIAFRRGRDARSIPWEVYEKLDTQQLAAKVAHAIRRYNPDAVFIDGGGVGGGVVDSLKAMRFKVIEVQSGGSAEDKNKYRNKRAEMWGLMNEWVEVGCLPQDDNLMTDLGGPSYSWHPITGQLIIESKDDMKKRGVASPDKPDALAHTFARPVARTDVKTSRGKQVIISADIDYPVFG